MSACTQSFEDDMSMASVETSAVKPNTSGLVRNRLYSEFLNWDSIDFTYAYQEAPDRNGGNGAYVFIAHGNMPEDTLRITINPVDYQVGGGYYLVAAVSGKVNRMAAQNYSFESGGDGFYKQISEYEAELYFHFDATTNIRTPSGNLFTRKIRACFRVPR